MGCLISAEPYLQVKYSIWTPSLVVISWVHHVFDFTLKSPNIIKIVDFNWLTSLKILSRLCWKLLFKTVLVNFCWKFRNAKVYHYKCECLPCQCKTLISQTAIQSGKCHCGEWRAGVVGGSTNIIFWSNSYTLIKYLIISQKLFLS